LKHNFFYVWIVVAICFCLQFLVGGTRLSLPILLPYWVDKFGGSMAAASLAISITSLAQCIIGIISGRLIDVWGPRVLGIAGCALAGLGLLLSSRVSRLEEFYACFILLGVGLSAIYMIPTTIVNKWFLQKRGLATGIVMAGGGVGTIVFPVIAGELVLSGGWQGVHIFLGVLAFFFILPTIFLRHYPEDMGLSAYGKSEIEQGANWQQINVVERGWTFSAAAKSNAFWLMIFLGLLSGFGHYIPWTQIATYARDLGLPQNLAAHTMAVIGACSMAGRVLLGGLGDRVGRKTVAAICFGVQGLAIFYLTGVNSSIGFYLFAVLSGLSHGGMITQFTPMLADFYGRSHLGFINGVFMAITGLGWALGSWYGGYVFDLTRSFSLAFVSGVLAYVVAIILLWFLKKPGTRS